MSTDIMKRETMPSFLSTDTQPEGLEELQKIVRPSRAKIIQAVSSADLINKFGIGSIIITPENQLLTKGGADEFISIVPVLYYVEWVKITSIKLRDSESMVADRSLDPKSDIALKSQNEATWSEPHPKYPNDEKYNYRYCENLNFVVKTIDPDLIALDPILVTFARTNHVTGQRLAKLATSRKQSLYSGVYALGTKIRERSGNVSQMFTIENHPTQMWVTDEDLFAELKSCYADLKEKLKQGQIEAVLDEDLGAEEAEDTGTY